MRNRTADKGTRALRSIKPTPEVALKRREDSIAKLTEIIATSERYKRALERIAEADDEACPHVKVALEALNPTAG